MALEIKKKTNEPLISNNWQSINIKHSKRRALIPENATLAKKLSLSIGSEKSKVKDILFHPINIFKRLLCVKY